MPDYDASRRIDLANMQAKLLNPETSEREREQIRSAQSAIRDQAGFKSIQKMREQLYAATINGDQAKREKLEREALKIDRDYRKNPDL